MDWEDARRMLTGERLPVALVDLDAVTANIDALVASAGGIPIRVASKSIRHVGLLRRILDGLGEACSGLMCFSVEEAVALAGVGFDDLLVAYPTLQSAALRSAAQQVAAGKTIRLMADDRAHLVAMDAAGRSAGVTLEAILELDVSYRPLGGRIHLGARRSPLRSPADVVALARAAADLDGVRLVGLMAYEGHIAGLPDASPFQPALNPVKRLLKRRAYPAAAASRAATVAALEAVGVSLSVVNAGGTGSVHLNATESAITEVTAGSGFLCSHLFDYYADLNLKPAAFFALEVVRRSDPGIVTCAGGGYIASGEPGWDRLPLPVLPPGLRYISVEGAGEVQTPLRVPPGVEIPLGAPVLFRHSKAGEPAERFVEYLLLSDGQIVAREPTYRGMSWCFF
ncbi:MAG: D-serine deaminase-like pyridoxal phosphate-dependent protein [Myxococcota bacterium]|jgi:D-serine deaminase-like pyridoxal phosphate-dependent protein